MTNATLQQDRFGLSNAPTQPSNHSTAESAVLAEAIEFSYGTRRVFSDFSLSLPRGKMCGLLGPNGSGKSTLLRLVATLDFPHRGVMRVFGLDTMAHTRKVRQRIGVVFQTPSLDKRLTVRENLRYHGLLYGLRKSELNKRVGHVLEICEISDRGNDFVRTLSGGLQRRVEIAKALLHQPELLVLDEPTTGLDMPSRQRLLRHIRELCATEQVSVLLTTHLLDEGELCDEVVILHRGRVVAQGPPERLIAGVGGHVVWVSTSQPELLAAKVGEHWKLEPQLIEGRLRIELPREINGYASQFIVELVERNPGLVSSLTLAQPTLEDVFIHATGHSSHLEGSTMEEELWSET